MRHPAPVLLALLLCACGGEPKSPPAEVAAAPPRVGEEPSLFDGDLDARGTEPFWGLKIRADGLTISRPGAEDIRAPNPGLVEADDTAVWTTTLDGQPLIVTITDNGPCSDGMSDLRYPFVAQMVIGTETLTGCAFRTGEPPAQPAP